MEVARSLYDELQYNIEHAGKYTNITECLCKVLSSQWLSVPIFLSPFLFDRSKNKRLDSVMAQPNVRVGPHGSLHCLHFPWSKSDEESAAILLTGIPSGV